VVVSVAAKTAPPRIGRAHCRTEVIALIHNADATVITTDGTVLSEHTLDPTHGYQPKRKNG
jgi:hypothetical protein